MMTENGMIGGDILLEFEALTTTVLWDIMPYNPLKIDHYFEGTSSLRLQGRRISHTINKA
jgi:hypothetical protein